MKLSKNVTLFSVMMGLTVTGCGGKYAQQSNLDVDSETANQNLQARLQESVRLRDLIKSIEDALRPVDLALQKINLILGEQNIKLHPRQAISSTAEFRVAIQSLNKGMIEPQANDRWSTERGIQWPFERFDSMGNLCPIQRVGLTVQNLNRKSGELKASVYVRDCNVDSAVTIAEVEQISTGEVKIDFRGLNQEVKNNPVLNLQACSLVLDPDHVGFNLKCDPFSVESMETVLQFGPSTFTHHANGEAMNANVAIGHRGGSMLYDLSLVQKMGGKLETQFTKRAAPTP